MYWRLSNFYFFYFASLGALVPYWSLYLKETGFSALQIGELMALLMATKIISPNIWGWIADHTGQRMRIVRFGSLLSLLAFAGVFVASEYWSMALVMLLFSFFWNAALPQFEAATLSHLGEHTHRYSAIRLWGSIGFIFAVAALGPVLDSGGADLLPTVLLALFVGIWLSSLAVPEQGGHKDVGAHGSLRQVLRIPAVRALLVVCFLMQMSHGPYYTFYTLFMEEHGYTRSLIGQLWALGVVAEIGIFLLMPRLVAHYGLSGLLYSAAALTALRWLLIGLFPQYLSVVIFAQTLHAASFGIFHAVAIALFHRYFTGRHQGRGQALYSSISFGAGGAVGSLASGYLWSSMTPASSYFLAAVVSILALLIAWRWLGSH